MQATVFSPTLRPTGQIDPFATRWVFFAGDVIGTDRKLECKDLAAGGVEVIANTLVRSERRGYLRRGRLTPLEKWYKARVQEEYAHGVKTSGVPLDEILPMVETSAQGHHEQGTLNQRSSLVAKWIAPASEINQLITRNWREIPIGIVEVEPLRNVSFESVRDSGLQEIFTPSLDALPPTLREFEQRLQSPSQMNADVRQVQGYLLESVEKYRTFANAYLEAAHALVRIAVNAQGFTHMYDPIAETIMQQMEAHRVDSHLQRQMTQQGDVATALQQLVALQQQVLKGNVETKSDAVVAMMQAQIEEQRRQLLEQQEKINQLLAATVAKPAAQQPQQRR